MGLAGDIVASDFGKVATLTDLSSVQFRGQGPVTSDGSSTTMTEEDLARGLLVLVLNNIAQVCGAMRSRTPTPPHAIPTAQVACMTASQHGINRIFFVGSFLREGIMVSIH